MERHHYRFLLYSLLALMIGVAVAGVAYWAYFNLYAKFRPATVTRNTAAVQLLLDQGGWVSPGRNGPALYLVGYRACTECTLYQRDEFPKLAAAGVDTRVLIFAREDLNGMPQSTPAERSTVAEIWFNRDWNLYARWMATPRDQWSAPGLRPSDGDWARTAVVRSTRDYVNQLYLLLKADGLPQGYPLLIWRDRDGVMKACACADRRSWHFVRGDLGAKVLDLPVLSLPGSVTSIFERAREAVTGEPSRAAPAPARTPGAPAAGATPVPTATQAAPTAVQAAPAASAAAPAAAPTPSAPATAAPAGKSDGKALFY